MVRLHDLPGVFADYIVGTVIVMTQMSMIGWVQRQERRRKRPAVGDRLAGPASHITTRGYPPRRSRIQSPPN